MKRVFFLLVPLLFLIVPNNALGYQSLRQSRDTIKIVNDSLIQMIRIKDSLLLQASLDSLFLSNIIKMLEEEKDSITLEYRELILQTKTDSANQAMANDSAQKYNRNTRWDLRDSIYLIDEDSIRRSIGRLLDVMFDDSARSPRPEMLRHSMYQLMDHLAMDSIHFNIINGKLDTIPFVIKKGRVDSTAFFLLNSSQDSAKVFMRTLNKNTLYMWIEDDLNLTQLLKKPASPYMVIPQWKGPGLKPNKRPVPKLPPLLWDFGAQFTMMINQVAFSHWKKGGNSSVAFTSDIKIHANYTKGNLRWNNDLQILQGIQKQELQDLRKSQDRLQIESGFTHKAFKNFSYSLSGGFLSQTYKGYSYPNDSIPVSKFMAPGVFDLNLGMEYKPSKNLKLTLSPAACKFTAVLDTILINKTTYGLKEGQRVRPELGTGFYGEYKTVLFKNVNLKTQLKLFSNYLDHPEKVDVDWRMNIDLKVNKYLVTTIKTHLIFDDDILINLYEVQDGKKVKVGEGKKIQFMEVLAISFKFFL